MRKTLVMDADTREMRVRYHDTWNGNHEVTEYRVTDVRGGDAVHNLPDYAGLPVLGTVPGLYIRPVYTEIPVYTQETAVGPTVKTPCPKATNRRRKCTLCAEL